MSLTKYYDKATGMLRYIVYPDGMESNDVIREIKNSRIRGFFRIVYNCDKPDYIVRIDKYVIPCDYDVTDPIIVCIPESAKDKIPDSCQEGTDEIPIELYYIYDDDDVTLSRIFYPDAASVEDIMTEIDDDTLIYITDDCREKDTPYYLRWYAEPHECNCEYCTIDSMHKVGMRYPSEGRFCLIDPDEEQENTKYYYRDDKPPILCFNIRTANMRMTPEEELMD